MTKYLVLALVIAVVLWWARSRSQKVPHKPRAAPPALQAMVPCTHCGVHLPRAEAVPGVLGLYCCDEHRRVCGDRSR